MHMVWISQLSPVYLINYAHILRTYIASLKHKETPVKNVNNSQSLILKVKIVFYYLSLK